MQTYVYPILGDRPAHLIEETEVLDVLRPIWSGSRIRGRIESILEQPEIRKLRQGDNPARWRGNLEAALPAPKKVRRVQHHPAMPFQELPAFMSKLQKEDGIPAKALQFTILSGSRTNEILGATWIELDLERRIWTIPSERMKAHKQHRVPLSDAAVVLLHSLVPKDEGYVFPGRRSGNPMSNMAMAKLLQRMGRDDVTVHGFRSSFRDWAAEVTDVPREVVEMALAHTIDNDVEAAHRRGDLFEKRRHLMRSWADFAMQRYGTVLRLEIEGSTG